MHSSNKTGKEIVAIIILLFVSVIYIKAQKWEPYESWFTHNSDYLLQQVVALEHPNHFENDFIYNDSKYITWNPQGMIYFTRLIYRITEDPFTAVKYLAFVMCFLFAMGYYLLFREITNNLFWGLFLSLLLVIFYDQYWGNGFGMPYMGNFWARVFFKVFLGWLIFIFMRTIDKPGYWPLFGLFLGLIGALVHPKPTLAWAGAFCVTFIIISLRKRRTEKGKLTFPKLEHPLPLLLMIGGIMVPILIWAVFGARVLDKPDYVTQEIVNTIQTDRSGLTWYIWQIFPMILNYVIDGKRYAGTLLLFGLALYGIYTYFKKGRSNPKLRALFICGLVFFSIIIIIPSFEFIVVQFTDHIPQLSPLSVNLSALRLWLLMAGAPGIVYWCQTRTSVSISLKFKNHRLTPTIEERAKTFLICFLLLIGSFNIDWNSSYGWITPSIKNGVQKIAFHYNLSSALNNSVIRKLQSKNHDDLYFREALNAAKKTPTGSLFYCYDAMNYVRVGALRPVVFSIDDKQKCVVSKKTYDKYLIAKKNEEYLKNNKPESMPFEKALGVYIKLGAEYVFDKRQWPKPGKDKKYDIFYQNRDWTIIKLLD